MTNLPCPNPACTHQFSAQDVKGATALKCPRCGTIFQFRQGGAASAPAVPVARPVAATPPIAKPVTSPIAARPASAPPPAARPVQAVAAGPPPAPAVDVVPVSSPPADDYQAGGAPMVRLRMRRKSSGVKTVIFTVLGLALAAGAVMLFLKLRESIGQHGGFQSGSTDKFVGQIRNSKGTEERVFQIVTPKKSWRIAEGIRTGLKATSGMGVVALKRVDEEGRAAWVAAAAKDFGFRKPRDAELVKDGLERLDNLFGETLELKEKPETKELAGQRAQAIEFKGTLNQVVWRGECYLLTRHGIGYWFLIAAPTLPETTRELEELQQDNRGFTIIDDRRGWREQPSKQETFRGDKVALSLTAPEAVWEKKDVADVDEHGVLLLYGRYLQEKDNRKNAQVLAVALEDQGNPLQAARSYFEEERKKENKDYQFEKSGEGIVSGRKIPYVEVKVQLGPQPARYFLIAAVQSGDHTIGILCDSTWESRQIWRQDFLDLLKTLRRRETKD